MVAVVAAKTLIQAGGEVTSVIAVWNFAGSISAGRDVGPVDAGRTMSADVTAGRDIASVSAGWDVSGDLTAGRDIGDLGFERRAVVEHVRFAADAIRSVTGSFVVVELTDLTGDGMREVMALVRDALPDVDVRDRPDRDAGRAYYDRVCFKAYASAGEHPFEIADGGLVDWTQRLVPSRKERLMISGLGVERLALALRS